MPGPIWILEVMGLGPIFGLCSIIKDIETNLFRRVIALMMSVNVIMNTEVFHLVEVAIEI
jgi:hypothetical protein